MSCAIDNSLHVWPSNSFSACSKNHDNSFASPAKILIMILDLHNQVQVP